ncbi:MAG: hypothetical protein ACQKBV_07270, partial [Puniceicoccales bacterium]
MIPKTLIALLFTFTCAAALFAQPTPGERAAKTGADIGAGFVFEGDVDHVDPVLREDVGPPQVLAGTLEFARVSPAGKSRGKTVLYNNVAMAGGDDEAA